MGTQIPNSIPSKRLSQAITASDSSFKLNNILAWDGTTDLTSGDFGTQAFGVFRNADGSLIELFEFDPSTIASASITISNRGLKFNGDETEVAANKLAWAANDTIVELGTNVPQLLNNFVDKSRAQTISGVKTFSALPQITAGNPIADNDIANKGYVDLTATGGATFDQNLISGAAGETVAAGEVIYLKESDGEWYLADASISATCENVIIGIAQGAGTDGVAVTDGILIGGIDKNATYTAGAKYYISNVAGGLITTPGGVEVLVGTGDANNNLVFEHIVTLESLTAREKDIVGKLLLGTHIFAADAEASDTYVITLSPAVTAYSVGQIVRFSANTANTDAATINVNGLGAKTIKKQHDQDLTTGDIESGQIVTLIYDGVNFQMQSQVASSAGGGADVQTFTGSGTYTKPSGALRIFVQVWGAGGGSGGCGATNPTASGAGGGGGYKEFMFAAGDVGATETVTIGAGGAAGASGANDGGVGGNTTFGSLMTAYGGGGGEGVDGGTGGGGGGAGGFSVGGVGVAGAGGDGGTPGDGTQPDGMGGADGGSVESVMGGAGGATGAAGATTGGISIYAGAGGGSGEFGQGGVSEFGGDGGDNSGNNSGATAGTQPGGGAGAPRTTVGGAQAGALGALGQIIVTTYI